MIHSKDQDIVSARVFAGRLAVTISSIRAALKIGTISVHKKCPPGKRWIDFTTEAPKFIAASPNPSRYSKEMIARRIKLHPELAHLTQQEIKSGERYPNDIPIIGRDIKAIDSLDKKKSKTRHKSKKGDYTKLLHEHTRDDGDELTETVNDYENAVNLSTARATREHWRGKREKFEFKRLQGLYIETEIAAQDWEDIATITRVRIMEIPDRVDAQITGLVMCECGGVKIDREKINALLKRECESILKKVAYSVEKMAIKYAKKKNSRTTQDTEDEDEEE